MRPGMKTLFSKGFPWVVLLAYLFLSLEKNLCLSISFLVLMTGVIVTGLSFSLFMESKHRKPWSPVLILFVALVIRLLFVFEQPCLSDDIYRYYVDGTRILGMSNPYRTAPARQQSDDPAFSEILKKVNHPELVTIYPPAAQLVFALAAFPGSITGMKVFFVFMDLAVCYMIFLLISRIKVHTDRAVLYAWHPLPVLETAHSGHIDTAALFFLFAALICFRHRTRLHGMAAGALLAASCLVKLFPLVFVPAFFLKTLKKERFVPALSFGLTVFLLCLVFLPHMANGVTTLLLYMTDWEFSGFLFRSLRAMGISPLTIRILLGSLFVIWIIRCIIAPESTPGALPLEQLLKSFYLISLGYLLLTPTIHPWYALYLVAFIPFSPGVAGICLSWSVFLSYYILINYKTLGLWQEISIIPFLVFAAPCLGWTIHIIVSRVRKTNARSIYLDFSGLL